MEGPSLPFFAWHIQTPLAPNAALDFLLNCLRVYEMPVRVVRTRPYTKVHVHMHTVT